MKQRTILVTALWNLVRLRPGMFVALFVVGTGLVVLSLVFADPRPHWRIVYGTMIYLRTYALVAFGVVAWRDGERRFLAQLHSSRSMKRLDVAVALSGYLGGVVMLGICVLFSTYSTPLEPISLTGFFLVEAVIVLLALLARFCPPVIAVPLTFIVDLGLFLVWIAGV